jgi:hypothetical protein
MPSLKRGGPNIVKVQLHRQQCRWNTLIDSIWDCMRTTNLPPDKFARLMEYFQLNLDETCVMANDGHLYIIAGHCSKMEKRLNNDSIIFLKTTRIGNAAGSEGSWILLYKGKTHQNNSLSDKNLVEKHVHYAKKQMKVLMNNNCEL